LGIRFADYLVVEAGFATAAFLHNADDLGIPVVARLKGNLPDLFQAAQKRFSQQAPKLSFRWGKDRIQVWDADDFDPWESLRWPTVRVLYYRQHKPDGKLIEAYWLTNFSPQQVSTRSLFRMAKSRWEIENQGFNEVKNQHDLEHIPHHQENSLLAVAAERSGPHHRAALSFALPAHPRLSAIELCRLLWLNLARPVSPDTS
jgi:hypothetical protein